MNNIINKKGRKEKNLAMVIIPNRCVGCGACYVACKTEWEVPASDTAYRTKVFEVEKINRFKDVSIKFLPTLCNQCEQPPCVNVCPVGATYKRNKDGIVVVDTDACIGCQMCISACPYNARYYNEEKSIVDKCNFCLPRISNGLEPACVRTCVGKARIFGDIDDPNSEVSKVLKEAKVIKRLNECDGLNPNVYYVTL